MVLHGVVRPPLQQAWSTQVRARGGAVGSPDERAHHQRASRRTPSSGSRGHSGCLGSFICRHSDARRRCWGPGMGGWGEKQRHDVRVAAYMRAGRRRGCKRTLRQGRGVRCAWAGRQSQLLSGCQVWGLHPNVASADWQCAFWAWVHAWQSNLSSRMRTPASSDCAGAWGPMMAPHAQGLSRTRAGPSIRMRLVVNFGPKASERRGGGGPLHF